jgi:hypothetical protein
MKNLLTFIFLLFFFFTLNAQTSYPMINGNEQILQDKQYKIDEGIYMYIQYNRYNTSGNNISTSGKIVIDNETEKSIIFMNVELINDAATTIETSCDEKCREIDDNKWNLVSIKPYNIRTIEFTLEGNKMACLNTNVNIINFLH